MASNRQLPAVSTAGFFVAYSLFLIFNGRCISWDVKIIEPVHKPS